MPSQYRRIDASGRISSPGFRDTDLKPGSRESTSITTGPPSVSQRNSSLTAHAPSALTMPELYNHHYRRRVVTVMARSTNQVTTQIVGRESTHTHIYIAVTNGPSH